MKNYGTDNRDRAAHPHSIPVLDELFVRAIGANTFRFSKVREVEFTVNPATGAVTGWLAYVGGNANTAIECLSAGSQWKWTDWHSMKDDELVRGHLDNRDMAEAQLAADNKAAMEKAMAEAQAPGETPAPPAADKKGKQTAAQA